MIIDQKKLEDSILSYLNKLKKSNTKYEYHLSLRALLVQQII